MQVKEPYATMQVHLSIILAKRGSGSIYRKTNKTVSVSFNAVIRW